MTVKCEHKNGYALQSTRNHPDHDYVWVCRDNCGHWEVVHPVFGMSFPNKKKERKKSIPLSKEGKY